MKTHYIVGLALLAGYALGALAVQKLRAEPKPPTYYITEIEVTDLDAYMKEYAPKAQASAKAHGGRILAAGEDVIAIEGEPPQRRVGVVVWDGLEQLESWLNSDVAGNLFTPTASTAMQSIRRSSWGIRWVR